NRNPATDKRSVDFNPITDSSHEKALREAQSAMPPKVVFDDANVGCYRYADHNTEVAVTISDYHRMIAVERSIQPNVIATEVAESIQHCDREVRPLLWSNVV